MLSDPGVLTEQPDAANQERAEVEVVVAKQNIHVRFVDWTNPIFASPGERQRGRVAAIMSLAQQLIDHLHNAATIDGGHIRNSSLFDRLIEHAKPIGVLGKYFEVRTKP